MAIKESCLSEPFNLLQRQDLNLAKPRTYSDFTSWRRQQSLEGNNFRRGGS